MREWRKMPGWPYESGVVDGVAVVRRIGSRYGLKVTIDPDGYERVTLYRVRDGKRERKTFGVHQVVALSWHGPPEVLHGPNGKRDNRPGELRWGSRRANELEKGPRGSIPGRRTGIDEWGNGKGEKGIDRKEGRGVAPPSGAVAPIAGDMQR